MKNKIYFLFCIAVISFSILIGSYKNHIVFLDKNTLYHFLIQDGDNYYKTFTEKDMKVRNIKNIQDYYNFIGKSTSEFNNIQKQNISYCIQKADVFFSQLQLPYINGNKVKDICWTIGSIKGKLYENGLPHTRSNVILLPSELTNRADKELTSLLIHEKVHVYQKLYPQHTQNYFKSNGLYVYSKRSKYDNIRANPDTDNLIYKDTDGTLYAKEYIEEPKQIEDVTLENVDHPNEKMSYDIGNMFSMKN